MSRGEKYEICKLRVQKTDFFLCNFALLSWFCVEFSSVTDALKAFRCKWWKISAVVNFFGVQSKRFLIIIRDELFFLFHIMKL